MSMMVVLCDNRAIDEERVMSTHVVATSDSLVFDRD